MNQIELARLFDAQRPRLRTVAYRVLGSVSEADDAVQDAWLRLQRSDPASIKNLEGWLTTVVARICLNMLRDAKRDRTEPLEDFVPEPIVSSASSPWPSTKSHRCSIAPRPPPGNSPAVLDAVSVTALWYPTPTWWLSAASLKRSLPRPAVATSTP